MPLGRGLTSRAMTSRRRLTSVADGTARAFANRGNDVDGWWALSLLLEATTPADPDFSIDLLTGMTVPHELPDNLLQLGPAWARYLSWSLGRHRVARTRVALAHLALRFERAVAVPSHISGGTDHPFSCTVTIEDDLGRLHESTIAGHCARRGDFTEPNPYLRPRRSAGPHDPGRVNQRLHPGE
jgi:hypothetical protein